jgi:hypothetical protein
MRKEPIGPVERLASALGVLLPVQETDPLTGLRAGRIAIPFQYIL